MNTNISRTIITLQRKRAQLMSQINKLGDVIMTLQELDSVSNGDKPEVEKVEPPKRFIEHKEAHATRFRYEAIKPVEAVIDYLKREKREASAKELFEFYCSLGGYPKQNRNRYYPRFYQAIHAEALRSKTLMTRVTLTPGGRRALFSYMEHESKQ